MAKAINPYEGKPAGSVSGAKQTGAAAKAEAIKVGKAISSEFGINADLGLELGIVLVRERNSMYNNDIFNIITNGTARIVGDTLRVTRYFIKGYVDKDFDPNTSQQVQKREFASITKDTNAIRTIAVRIPKQLISLRADQINAEMVVEQFGDEARQQFEEMQREIIEEFFENINESIAFLSKSKVPEIGTGMYEIDRLQAKEINFDFYENESDAVNGERLFDLLVDITNDLFRLDNFNTRRLSPSDLFIMVENKTASLLTKALAFKNNNNGSSASSSANDMVRKNAIEVLGTINGVSVLTSTFVDIKAPNRKIIVMEKKAHILDYRYEGTETRKDPTSLD